MADLQTLLDELLTAARGFDGPLAGAVEQMDWFLGAHVPREHVAVFSETGFVIEHPLSCRRSDQPMSACTVHRLALADDASPVVPGRYIVSVCTDRLELGARLGDGIWPAEEDTLPATETEEGADGGGQQEQRQDEQPEGQQRRGRRDGGKGSRRPAGLAAGRGPGDGAR